MNVSDIARLKFKNLTTKTITFIRQKIKKTSKENLKPIEVFITPEIQLIIDKYSNADKQPDNYVFPILTNGLTPEIQHKKIKFFTKLINKHIKQICKTIGIESNVSTYSARHSFATILQNSEVPISYISKSLGHNSIKTTESYLGSFSMDKKKEYTQNLLNFNKDV